MITLTEIKLFNQISTLSPIKSSNNIQTLVIKSKRSMEISPCIQVCNLNPCIRSNIIDFTFIHWFWWQRWPNCKNLTLLFFNQHACQCMSSSFKQHISSLNQSLFHKLIAAFCSLARLTTSGEENPAFFVLNTHEVSRYFNINDVRPITMTPEVVHKQIMCVINKKVQGV